MCKKEYINIQTGEKLDLDKLNELPNNAMLKVKPELWCEWDFEKNIEWDIMEITKSEKLKLHWICEKGHNHESLVYSKVNSRACKYCDNKDVLIGYNDINTTNKKVADLMLNDYDKYKYTQKSDSRVDFKCPTCDSVIRNIQIKNVTINGLNCPICKDGYSYPEKFMYSLLSNLNIEFLFDRKLSWSVKNRRYDFYIPAISTIIETHGAQHYGSKINKNNRNEQLIDREKRLTALSNGILNYVEVDCRFSEFEYIKDSVLRELSSILELDKVDWNYVKEKCNTSMVKETLRLWNEGVKDVKILSEKLKIHEATTYRYLRELSDIGICDASEYLNGNLKKVVKLTVFGEFIGSYNSIREASRSIGNEKLSPNISTACLGKRNQVGGFKWMYEDDYLKFKQDSLSIRLGKKKQEVPVVQLTIDGEYVSRFISMAEANRITGANVNVIRMCCNGKLKSANGFRWITLVDYEEMLKKGRELDNYKNNSGNPKEIVQLTMQGDFIRVFNSAQEAYRENKKFNASGIRRCCNGYLKSVAGFKWMNKEDYEKLSK